MCVYIYIYIYTQRVPKRCIHTSNNCICEHFEEEDFYFQQDGTPPHYHRDVTSFLNTDYQTGGLDREVLLNTLPVHQTSYH